MVDAFVVVFTLVVFAVTNTAKWYLYRRMGCYLPLQLFHDSTKKTINTSRKYLDTSPDESPKPAKSMSRLGVSKCTGFQNQEENIAHHSVINVELRPLTN